MIDKFRDTNEQSFKPHSFEWVIENLRAQQTYLERSMFGCRACYLNGELKLVLADSGEEPWNGVLVATSREQHQSLVTEFPELHAHPILGKWLYLPERAENFDKTALAIERIILRGDARICVVARARKRKKKKAARKR